VPTVTALRRVAARRPGAAATRVSVEVDGADWLVLEEADVLRLGLHAGLALDDALASQAAAAAREADATRRAGRLLSHRPRSRAELERRLKPTAGAVTAGVVTERLEQLGVVDDRAYARALADERLRRGYGPGAIRHLLAERGVEEPLAADVVDELDGDDVLAAARRAVAGSTGAAAWRRLAARGFDEDVAEAVLGTPEDWA
jgi:SOS response regulatory protein OraA/RecX